MQLMLFRQLSDSVIGKRRYFINCSTSTPMLVAEASCCCQHNWQVASVRQGNDSRIYNAKESKVRTSTEVLRGGYPRRFVNWDLVYVMLGEM
jgi:hypothetical protein